MKIIYLVLSSERDLENDEKYSLGTYDEKKLYLYMFSLSLKFHKLFKARSDKYFIY